MHEKGEATVPGVSSVVVTLDNGEVIRMHNPKGVVMACVTHRSEDGEHINVPVAMMGDVHEIITSLAALMRQGARHGFLLPALTQCGGLETVSSTDVVEPHFVYEQDEDEGDARRTG